LTAGAVRPSVRARPGTIEITDDRMFGPGSEALARRFARRVLRFAELSALALDPARTRATLSYRMTDGDTRDLLGRLADAVAGIGRELDDAELPQWPFGEPVTLYRHASIISNFKKLNVAHGQVTARHPTMERNPAIARRVENAMRVIPGVIEATAVGELRVRFDPQAVAVLQLIRLAEAQLIGRETVHTVTAPEPVNFRLENVTLGVAAVGEFVLPLMAPVASGLLVLAALNTFGVAISQLRERKIGLPLLYTCAVGTRLSSGQFLAASLLSWFFRYWESRYLQDVEVESRGLIDETATRSQQARVLTADGLVRLVPTAELAAGHQVRVLTAEHVPVDGRVCGGAALVGEGFLGGQTGPVRRVTGDPVLAGSRVLAGTLDIESLHTGNDTRAARIAQTLIETTVPLPHPEALNQDAEDFASRTVAPTLLTAGAGLAIGDLTTAGAILSPDYATGVGLAMPLERVRDVRSAIRIGAVICTRGAFERLAKTSWLVLDEHEALHRAGCEVAEVRTKGFDEARLLPAMAAAGIWLGDERGPAIARACRDRGLVVRRAVLREIDADGVAIDLGKHLVRLRGSPVVGGTAPPPLIAEVDGVEVAGIRFVRNGYLEAADAVRSLQRSGQRVFLTSQRVAAGLADSLGVDRYGEGMSDDDKVRVLRDLQQQGLTAAYVGDGLVHAPVAREAHLSISLGRPDAAGEVGSDREPSDILLMSPSIAPLPALCALARDSARRKERRLYAVIAPNLVCVAGAFAFGFTPMAAVLLSNFGTSVAYNGAKRALREAEPMRLDDACYADEEPVRSPSLVPKTERAEIRMGK